MQGHDLGTQSHDHDFLSAQKVVSQVGQNMQPSQAAWGLSKPGTDAKAACANLFCQPGGRSLHGGWASHS